MKGLTITQPWAWAIVWLEPHEGPKRIENRPWFDSTMIGRQFAIHTSKNKYDTDGAGWMEDQEKMTREAIARAPHYNVRGAVIGLARLDRIIHARHEDPMLHDEWFAGEYGFVLRDVIRLTEPVPCRGLTGFWTVPNPVVQSILKQPRISIPNGRAA